MICVCQGNAHCHIHNTIVQRQGKTDIKALRALRDALIIWHQRCQTLIDAADDFPIYPIPMAELHKIRASLESHIFEVKGMIR